MKHAISKMTVNELTHDQLALIKNLKTLLDFRSGYINNNYYYLYAYSNWHNIIKQIIQEVMQ